MIGLLLAVVYVSFISLGLPDSMIGAAWPVMHTDLGVLSSMAGILQMLISCSTIISSLLSERMTKRFGAGRVTAFSVLTTAAALLSFSLTRSFPLLCILAVPYGLGAGAVDAALNNYVALHFKSRHMSWLHCMWGIGASIGPYIMSACITGGRGWSMGFRTVGLIQIVLSALIFLSLPVWKALSVRDGSEEAENAPPIGLRGALRIPGVPLLLLAFFSYCAMEASVMLWASTYLVQHYQLEAGAAAGYGSLYLLGITAGRFLAGFVSEKLGDRRMIRVSLAIIVVGLVLMLLPLRGAVCALIGLVVLGVGSGPIYPAIIHATPNNFGKENSQGVIGVQMASAYTGSTLMPSLFGFLSGLTSVALFPFYLAFFAGMVILMTERLNRVVDRSKA